MFLSATLVNYQRGLKLEFRARWCCADSVLNEKAGSDRELSGCLAVEQLSEAMDGPYDTDEDGTDFRRRYRIKPAGYRSGALPGLGPKA
ncbi:Protein of unknown function [Pyronema omphalodes CBS 100304]|uniref:Uncharacterized protein n=1 Tax=Pyronema omphalodes (strain CBS 100304) TaxID=1076935 RepID=U4LJ55_PYROM|nr:Protein of unknown function [Pyronema omphalodes CBS 100304]